MQSRWPSRGSAFEVQLDRLLEVFLRLVGLDQDAFDLFRIGLLLLGYGFDQGLEVGFAGQLAFLMTASDCSAQLAGPVDQGGEVIHLRGTPVRGPGADAIRPAGRGSLPRGRSGAR